MSSKQNITLKTTIEGQEYNYSGRFLGFLKDDEFNAMVQSVDKVAGKIESKATMSLVALARSTDTLPAQRLVMTVKSINGESIIPKKLFISPRCHFVSSVGGTEVIIELENEGNNSLVIEEVAT